MNATEIYFAWKIEHPNGLWTTSTIIPWLKINSHRFTTEQFQEELELWKTDAEMVNVLKMILRDHLLKFWIEE